MKSFIFLAIFAFQFADFGQTQFTITPPIPLYCDCFKEWFEDRAQFFETENPRKLAKKIFNSWNTIEDDDCITKQEYKNNHIPNYCGGYVLWDFIDANLQLDDYCLTKKELKKALKKIKRSCF